VFMLFQLILCLFVLSNVQYRSRSVSFKPWTAIKPGRISQKSFVLYTKLIGLGASKASQFILQF
jgi:hypothetical protein